MFGNPNWFRLKSVGWGVQPVQWRGRLYSLIWMMIIALPAVILVIRHQAPEATVWVGAMLATFAWDVRCIRRQIQSVASSPIFIDDDGKSVPYTMAG